MQCEHRLFQLPTDIIDVGINGWEPDADFPFGPQGAKPKRILICPTPAPHNFLIAGHRYLFKHPEGFKIQQIWSEIIAYEIARTLDVQVPPAYAAWNSRDGTIGVLIEYFHGYQDEPQEVRFADGNSAFGRLNENFNKSEGSLTQNIRLSRAFNITGSNEWWAKTITFDALIGNTDRHSENWGFLYQYNESGVPSAKMSPVYDNGTSLGQIIQDEHLHKYIDENAPKFINFIKKGFHHFNYYGDRGHIDLCKKFHELQSNTRLFMHGVIQLPDNRIDEILSWAQKFDFGVKINDQRRQFMRNQLIVRRNALTQAFGG